MTSCPGAHGEVRGPHIDVSRIVKGDGIFSKHWRLVNFGCAQESGKLIWGQELAMPAKKEAGVGQGEGDAAAKAKGKEK